MLWHPVQKLTQFNRVQNFHFGNEIVINKQTAQVSKTGCQSHSNSTDGVRLQL